MLGFLLQQNQWSLCVNKENIKVYTRKSDSVSIKEYKVTMQVGAPIDSVLKKILDTKNLKNWSYKTTQSSLVKKINDSVSIIYMRNHLGFPVKDRDHVSKVQVIKKSDGYLVLINPFNNFVKEKEDVIRLKKFHGFWSLKKLTDNQTEVSQQLYGDPESNIPTFLINMMIVKAPFESFKEFRNQLESKK